MALNLLTVAVANAGITAMFPNPGSAFASLHTGSPGQTGASEVVGGSYARQSLLFAAPSAGVELSSNAQNWTNMPAVTVSYFGVWSVATGGTFSGGGLLGSSLTVPAGGTVTAGIGALSVGISG
jgi:hypothetical protein